MRNLLGKLTGRVSFGTEISGTEKFASGDFRKIFCIRDALIPQRAVRSKKQNAYNHRSLSDRISPFIIRNSSHARPSTRGSATASKFATTTLRIIRLLCCPQPAARAIKPHQYTAITLRADVIPTPRARVFAADSRSDDGTVGDESAVLTPAFPTTRSFAPFCVALRAARSYVPRVTMGPERANTTARRRFARRSSLS